MFALNRVWERTVKDVPVRYDAVLGEDPQPPVSNVSDSIHVSLNDLELADQMATIQPTVSVTIAAAGAEATAADVTAVADRRAAYASLSIPSVQITNVAVTQRAGGGDHEHQLDGYRGSWRQRHGSVLRRGVDYCAVCPVTVTITINPEVVVT